MKVLITAPSLDETQNVSGISTIVRQIIDHGTHEFVHFAVGRRDREKTDAAWIAKQIAVPFRFYARLSKDKPDLVHINTALTELSILRDAALSFAATQAGVPVVLAVHGGKYLVNDFTNSLLKTAAAKMLKLAKVVVVYSDFERKEIAKRWPNVDIRILPNAIPFDSIPAMYRENKTPVLVFFGRMHESKGLQEIIEAAEILTTSGFRFEFRAYGEGPLREFFVTEMTRVLGEQFRYGGIIAGNEKWKALGSADIFVLPSRYGEGLPMAMLEAMAVGCVAVASDVASVTSVLRDGRNGYVVRSYDAPGLASKLKILLSDRFGWNEIQLNAVATIRENFEITGYIKTLDEIYKHARA